MKNVIDTRDLQDRIEALQAEQKALEEKIEDATTVLNFAQLNDEPTEEAEEELKEAEQALKDWDGAEELKELEELKNEIGSEFEDGVTLVADEYWVDYVEELVKDIGDMPKEIPSYIVIDWEATAGNVQQDYSSVDYDGGTWWYRS